jgi:tetratricopeptide (TPR) repeat protein
MTKTRIWWAAVVAAAAMALQPAFGEDAEDAVETGEAAEADEGSASTDAIFEYLVAEFAAQRGDTDGALAVYQRMARELRSAAIARRAVEMAIRARSFGPALESASLLLELEPDSTLAREIIAALLSTDNNLDKARDTMAGILERSTHRGPILLQLGHLFGKFADKAAVLRATRAIAERYPAMAEAHYGVGVAALLASDSELALAEAEKALEINPGWDQGAILKAQVLRKSSAAEVIEFYRGFVDKHPGSTEVRLQLGRELATERKLGEAREQFREAEKTAPKDPHAAYAIGLLSLQLEDFPEAQSAFTRSLKLGHREPAAIYLGMGQAAEGLKRIDEAIGWYQKVDSGDWVRAQLKIATLIARQQGLTSGREYLHRISPRTATDRIQIVQVEAQLLRDAKAWRDTYDLLTGAVRDYPESFELLYDRAMAAEKIDRLDVLEADLRGVIKMKPDYAHAYNALGYTLAEKTDRLKEARELIEKAYKLSPEDPFIMDSLGWVHYRLGNMMEALRYLQQAYGARPDPEIAAHLGEALWKSGQREEAQKVWRAALTENPDHETLLAVMQKYRP